MKLWHDDIRKPPDDSWTWARTNKAAMEILSTGEVTEASLDHDLGLDTEDPEAVNAYMRRGGALETGVHLVEWMISNGHVPARITLHSWNPVGAKAMYMLLFDNSDSHVEIRPYEP